MSGERTFRWRTYRAFGAHLLEQEFDTPEAAGLWRHDAFPGHDGEAPLTLVCFEGGRQVPLRASELAAAHWAWLSPDHDETAAGRDDTPTPAA